MTHENWERLKPLFGQAIDLPSSGRAAFIDEVQHGDAQIGRQLKSLVQAYEKGTFFIDRPMARLDALTAEQVPLYSSGEVVLGRFKIVRLIGNGGMGVVYEAADAQLGRIALKTIHPSLAGDAGVLERFRREVQLARQITSQHVCRIHELFDLPSNGQFPASVFLTMEFLDGTTLFDHVRDRGPIPWREAEAIAGQICEGLAAVHEAGVVHRDLKSKNIMLSIRHGDPCVVLMDFGLAYGPAAASDETIAVTRGMAGTPEYMAPEQFETAGCSPATDIYALGVVLYEMVTGKLPFEGDSLVALALNRAKPLTPASSLQIGLPRRWDEAIGRCLEYEPRRRYQSAGEVSRALTRGAAPLRKTALRRWTAVALSGTALVLAGVFAWRFGHRYYVPPKAAMNWYEKGLTAFREGTYLKAAELFRSALDVDKKFGLARARLADAWNELDFQGDANKEMVAISAEDEQGLRAVDRTYVEAVRATLRRDFPVAVRAFQNELDELPDDEKASGYVDLGRAYEKAGNIPSALKAYERSRAMEPDAPAAWIRSAALEAREGDNSRATSDFDRAGKLYVSLGSTEGTAEAAYQLSYWQTILHHFEEARRDAQQSFNAAANMPVPSVQLEVRALCRLSDISHGSRDDDNAIADASKAISLAHNNGLEYWETDALIRQGAGYLGKGRVDESKGCFDEALASATRNQWPRLNALAQVELATLREKQHQPQDIAGLGSAADYYKVYQFPVESFNPLLLLVREQGNQSQYEGAVRSGLDLVSAARKLPSPAALAQAGEALAMSYFGLQDYPNALKCFDLALHAANNAPEAGLVKYELAHRAEVLAMLGRYDESEAALARLTAKDFADEKGRIEARLLLVRGKFHEASSLVKATLPICTDRSSSTAIGLRIVGAAAAAEAGSIGQGRKWLTEALTAAKQNSDEESVAGAAEVSSLLDLRSRDARSAAASAQEALNFLTEHGEKESEYFALCYLAQATRALGERELADQSASKALDILATFEHNWGTSAFQSYTRRTDISGCRSLLRLISAQ